MNAAGRDRLLFALAILVGAGAWYGVALLDARREAWDSPLFWSFALPAAYAACLGLGFFGSRQAWRWPALVLGSLFASAVVSAGRSLNLWPLTLGLIGLMAAVGLLPTYVGVGLRRLFDARRARRVAADTRLRDFVSETPPPPPA
ncbi:MAG: hypothetical protein ABIP29_05770 [Candidatus Eisenbacteria bacterium]